jgi:UDP-N-acetylmuramate dehydrogenase
MRVGGHARWLLEPATPDELVAAWFASLEQGFTPRILGGGANLIVADGELPGVVIGTDRLRRVFRPGPGGAQIAQAEEVDLRMAPAPPHEDPRLIAWSGASLPALARTARDLGYAGLEGLVGVPGHLGGAVAMNAGGRWGDTWDVVERVRLLQADGTVVERERSECTPRYRNGGLEGSVVLGAVLVFRPDSKAAIQERYSEYLSEKRRVQPVTERSAGCIFKNPDPERSEGRSAGKLVDDCGGKAFARGDAVVSPLHGNFIVNRGKASARNVFALIEDLRTLVLERTGIELETEVKIWRP